MLRICAVIPTYNRKNHLKKLLYQLKSQRIEDAILSIIVVVDGSNDGTYEMLRSEFPDVHIIKGTGNWWYTKSMNEGFKFASILNPDYVLTLNDDVEIENNYVKQLIYSNHQVKKDSIIGSISFTLTNPNRIVFSGKKDIHLRIGKHKRYHPFLHVAVPSDLTGIYPTKELPGRGILMPYKILKTLNYFDERFIQYGSDTDFCYRAEKAGYKLYISWDAKIFVHEKLTGSSSKVINTSLWSYTKDLFKKTSANSIYTSFLIIRKHVNFLFWAISLLIDIMGKYKSLFKLKLTHPLQR